MRFLFCSLASRGFLYPAIGMAQSLQRRGHSVSFVTDQAFSDELARNGLTRYPRGPSSDGPSFQVPAWPNPLSVAIQVKHIEHAVELFRPDVLVGQPLALGPVLVRERCGIPLASLGFATYIWPVLEAPSGSVLSESAERKRWRREDMLRLYNEVRKQFRMAPVDGNCETPLLGDLFMVRSVPALEGDISSLPGQVHLVGACLWEEDSRDDELEAWLKEAEQVQLPVIYVQQGRFFHTPHFWNKLVEGLAQLRVQVAASSERMDCESGQLPPNFFVRPYVPQTAVLRQAQAMVASSNTTAVLGALTAGVPSVLIPGGGEQPDVAEQCARAGVARMLSPEGLTSGQLCSEIESVLHNQALKQAAGRVASAFGQVDGFEVAADLLENLASTGSPVLRNESCRLAATSAI